MTIVLKYIAIKKPPIPVYVSVFVTYSDRSDSFKETTLVRIWVEIEAGFNREIANLINISPLVPDLDWCEPLRKLFRLSKMRFNRNLTRLVDVAPSVGNLHSG